MIKLHKSQLVFFISIFVLLLGNIQQSKAQSMQLFVDKKEILIGERINYTLQFSFPSKNFQVEFTIPDSIPNFEIMAKKVSDTFSQTSPYIIRQQILLTSWDSGKHTIPAFLVKIRGAGPNEVYSFSSPSVPVHIGYMPMDTTENIRDIKPIVPIKLIEKDWWPYIIGGILLLLLLFYLLYRYLKNRKKKPTPIFDETLTPIEEARKALESIKGANLYDPKEVKEYHTIISDTIKRYLGRKEQHSFEQSTTDELLMYLKSHQYDQSIISKLASALRSANAVKFAKFMPLPGESEESRVNTKSIIEQIESEKLKSTKD